MGSRGICIQQRQASCCLRHTPRLPLASPVHASHRVPALHASLQRYYIPGARELQRIESVTRSPIYSKFSEALAGVATIRAYRREEYFTAASDALMELNAYAFVTQRAASAWLAMRLDFLGLVILTVAGEKLSC